MSTRKGLGLQPGIAITGVAPVAMFLGGLFMVSIWKRVMPRSITIAALLFCLGCERRQPPVNESVYVWQRQWTGSVTEAVRAVDEGISKVMPLFAEVSFPDPEAAPKIISVPVDWEALSHSGKAVTAVIRIGDSASRTGWNTGAIDHIETLIATMRKRYPEIHDFQIDYDCPQSKLADYGLLLHELAQFVGRDKLSFTALPSWLSDRDSFSVLAREADHFVLQVHALDLPKSSSAPPKLIDERAARLAVEQSARVGARFYVALPTYGSFVLFDRESREIIDIVSEDLPPSWPERSIARLASADPGMMARLVRDWSRRRPAQMIGIAWYRLPVEGELLNWPDLTWKKVRRGEIPRQKWVVTREPAEGGIVTLSIKNEGEYPENELPHTIQVFPAQLIEGFDGSPLYSARVSGDRILFTLNHSDHDLVPLPISRSVRIGWLRSDFVDQIMAQPVN